MARLELTVTRLIVVSLVLSCALGRPALAETQVVMLGTGTTGS